MNLFAFNFVLMLFWKQNYNNTETNVAAYKKWFFLFLYFYWFYKLVGQMDRQWTTAITEALELTGGRGGELL